MKEETRNRLILWGSTTGLAAIGFLYLLPAFDTYFLLAWRNEVPLKARNGFVQEFLMSVRDDSPFFRKFVDDTGVRSAEALRPYLSGQFSVVSWDGLFMDEECIVRLSNDWSLNLLIHQRRRQVTSVQIDQPVKAPPKQSQSTKPANQRITPPPSAATARGRGGGDVSGRASHGHGTAAIL